MNIPCCNKTFILFNQSKDILTKNAINKTYYLSFMLTHMNLSFHLVLEYSDLKFGLAGQVDSYERKVM